MDNEPKRKKPVNDVIDHFEKIDGSLEFDKKNLPKKAKHTGYFMIGIYVFSIVLVLFAIVYGFFK
ncbi:hypothetical protein ACFSCX_14690 [Bacillus salitolerans]|uniref:Amino acid transporter n=1 Tax=Bacillus salitolerans TaxID=1437434 RepID=A0ABW4LSD7_9BACI